MKIVQTHPQKHVPAPFVLAQLPYDITKATLQLLFLHFSIALGAENLNSPKFFTITIFICNEISPSLLVN